MKLPQELAWPDADNRWASMIEPILNRVQNTSIVLENVALTTGTNVINHRLSRNLKGWKPTRIRGVSATFYDLQDANQTPELTLVLVSSANVTIDLEVF